MKNLFLVTLVVLFGLVACDNNSSQQVDAVDEMPVDTAVKMDDMAAGESPEDVSLTTPADMPEEAQAIMYKSIFDYNQCMMAERLAANQDGQHVQQAADAIMAACETHIDDITEILTANEVHEGLVVGMTKKMRSRAARTLMTQSMNAMAAQAAAVEAAEQMKAE